MYVILLLAFLIGADLVTKYLVSGYLGHEVGNSIVLLEGIFNFEYRENHGASFGMFSGSTVPLLILTSVIAAGIAVLLFVKPNFSWLLKTSLTMILGGALGNLYDRAVFGFVRDFIDYEFLDTIFGIDFAVGNVADIFVLVGAVLLIFYVVFDYEDAHFKGIRKCLRKKQKDNTPDLKA